MHEKDIRRAEQQAVRDKLVPHPLNPDLMVTPEVASKIVEALATVTREMLA